MDKDSPNQGIPQGNEDDIELTELIDDELISKLDSLKVTGSLFKKYSEIYIGGVYALKAQNRKENPDWMSQSANSFREILYILQKIESKALEKLLNDYFKKSLTQDEINEYRSYLGNLYKLFNDLTHHFSEVPDLSTQVYTINKNVEIRINPLTKEDYFKAIGFYKEYLKLLVVTALEIHKKIDSCVSRGIKDKDLVKIFFENSRDSKVYFLSLIDETWLRWLWTNGFFVELKKPAEDITKYGYRLPEFEYLTRVAPKDPATIAEIINSISVSKETFNPEIVDRFLWITGLLPAEQIKTLLPKILRENWVQLMSPFHRSGFEYKQIAEKLKQAKDFEALNVFAQIALSTRTPEELGALEQYYVSDKLFYLSDITDTDIFEATIDPENDRKEESLKIFLEILSRIVRLGKDKDEAVFAEAEPFYLLDVDIFNLKLDASKRTHPREDIQNLVATLRLLLQSVFSSVSNNETEARRLYDSYIAALPDSKTMYRLLLYAITRYPSFFKQEIRDALFRVFNIGERYFEVESGAEYHGGLIAGFKALDNATQREYVANVFEYFGASLGDEEKETWRKRDGLKILVFIKDLLTQGEIEQTEKLLGNFPVEPITPQPDMVGGRGGIVTHRSPVNLADFTVKEILEHLKNDWAPKVLDEKFRGDDFLNPRGAEGLGDGLKEDFKARFDEYFSNINKFFDRDSIDPSYLYSLLREIDEMLRNKKSLSNDQYFSLLQLFEIIRKSGEEKMFERSANDSWMADWITVHKMMSDIVLNILGDIKESNVFKENRKLILDIIRYLLSIKSSPNAEDDKRESEEPYHVAINSVRGQAYIAFVQFTYNDGKVLGEDVKELYKQVLDNDTSNALRFLIGYHLGAFYYRDIPFIKESLPSIFPKDEPGKEKLYFASWEGYLSGTLYQELFEELSEYYEYAVRIPIENYPDRKYSKGLDETLAAHLALAYAHFDFNLEDTLLDLFWKTPNETRHYQFASFIGRHYLTRDRASDEWLEEEKVSKLKLIHFWDWILRTEIPLETKTFSGFGFWINPTKEIISDQVTVEKMAASLKKSNGEIDWDYGLMQRLRKFAEVNPEKTLEIIRSLLLLNGDLNPNHRVYFDASGQIKEPLTTIYKIPNLKKPVEELVNSLIEKGSSTFWGLKEILD
jgi:hypothetical protein